MHCRSKELVRFFLYRTAAFGGWNAGLRPVARAASNRRRRLLASVDGVPYGFNVPYNDPTHNETTCNAPITVCQWRLAAKMPSREPGRAFFRPLNSICRAGSPTPPTGLDVRQGNAEAQASDLHRHCEERSDVAIRIPCDAPHRPLPEGTEENGLPRPAASQ